MTLAEFCNTVGRYGVRSDKSDSGRIKMGELLGGPDNTSMQMKQEINAIKTDLMDYPAN